MRELMWRAIAFLLSRKLVADYLISRSRRTPYFHLEGYMNRWWLFNAYSSDVEKDSPERYKRKWPSWFPSIRVHHILREDQGRHLHDHPWNARTVLLRGWYTERRINESGNTTEGTRSKGQTARILFGQYHSIDEVSPGGVYTLFFTWKYGGTWGFLVDGKKVPWREYTNEGKA